MSEDIKGTTIYSGLRRDWFAIGSGVGASSALYPAISDCRSQRM